MILRIELTVEDIKNILKVIHLYMDTIKNVKEFNKTIKLYKKLENAMKKAQDESIR